MRYIHRGVDFGFGVQQFSSYLNTYNVSANRMPFEFYLGMKSVSFGGTGSVLTYHVPQDVIPGTFTQASNIGIGDLLLELQIKTPFSGIKYNMPAVLNSEPVEFRAAYYCAYNFPIGGLAPVPTGKVYKEQNFYPMNKGIHDLRIGIIGENRFPDIGFEIDINAIYVFQYQPEEKMLPFGKSLFPDKKKNHSAKKDKTVESDFDDPRQDSWLFNIHEVLTKYIWPGRSAFPQIPAFPHNDDYLILNMGFAKDIPTVRSVFRYRVFTEFVGKVTWPTEAKFQRAYEYDLKRTRELIKKRLTRGTNYQPEELEGYDINDPASAPFIDQWVNQEAIRVLQDAGNRYTPTKPFVENELDMIIGLMAYVPRSGAKNLYLYAAGMIPLYYEPYTINEKVSYYENTNGDLAEGVNSYVDPDRGTIYDFQLWFGFLMTI